MSQNLFNWQRGVSEEERGVKREARAEIAPRAEALAESTGYSPEEQSALFQETMGPAASAFGKAREALGRRVARTRNTAGYAGGMAELAREEAKTQAEAGRRTRLAIADEQQRRREQGINLLARLYGEDVGAFTAGRRAAEGPLAEYANLANQKGFGSKLQDASLRWLFG